MTSPRDIQRQQLESLNRRGFIRAAGGCSALSSAAIMSTLLNLKASNAALAMQDDYEGYKAQVCIFLFGGNDSFNMLVPNEDDEYANYATIRGNPADGGLALAREDLLPITDKTGKKYGIHPAMPELKELYDNQNCAFISNVGTLVRPTTMADYQARRDLPLGLFSHADHIRHWQTSLPESRSQVTGWAGRMADLMTDTVNDNETVSMNISMSGVNIFETGTSVVPYVINTSGATEAYGYGNGNAQDRIYTRVTDGMLDHNYSDLLAKTYARTRRNSIDAAIQFNDAVNAVNLQTAFPQSYLGAQLRMIAKTIGARQILGQRRQVFFVTVGGWDHHNGVLDEQARKFPDLSQSVKAFYDATVELGVSRDVVSYTVSDFGRTLSSNGRGSDHAWGGNQFAVGGSVNGADVYGDYPDLLDNDVDVGRGRLIPTMSVDEHAAEIALWMGIKNDANLEAVLPNVRNFYSASNSQAPVGFLGGRSASPPGYPGGGGGPPGSPPSPPTPPPTPPNDPTPPPSGPGGGGGPGF